MSFPRIAPVTLTATVIAPLLLACSSATSTAARRDCEPGTVDSLATATGPVYRECAVTRAARPRDMPFQWSASSSTTDRTERCYSAEFELVVDAAGKPEPRSLRIISSDNPELTSAIIAAVPLWTFEPAEREGERVRQLVRTKHSVATRMVVVPAGESPRRLATRRPPRC